MANFFEDLFGGSGEEYLNKAQQLISESFGKQKELISGSAEASLREQLAESDIQAGRSGTAGTPVERAIRAAIRDSTEKTKIAGLTKAQAQQSQAESGLEMQRLADKRQTQAANLGTLGSVFQGLGNVFGYLNPIK